MRQPIAFLRQWLNEDRKATPMVTNEEIWHWLKGGVATAEPTPTVDVEGVNNIIEDFMEIYGDFLDGYFCCDGRECGCNRVEVSIEVRRYLKNMLTTLTAKHQADIEKARQEERAKCQISNFQCSNHGIITPRPICPKCFPDTTSTSS